MTKDQKALFAAGCAIGAVGIAMMLIVGFVLAMFVYFTMQMVNAETAISAIKNGVGALACLTVVVGYWVKMGQK